MIGLGTFGSVSLDNFSAPAGTAARVADEALIGAVHVVGSNDADLTH
jgi:hypothetical protein